MRPLTFAFILLAAVAAPAQTQHPNQPQRIFPVPSVLADPLVPPTPSSSTCPASIVASRRGTPLTLWTISQQDASDPAFQLNTGQAGSGLHVHLAPSPLIQMPRTILHAELAVEYIAPGTRTLPVNATHDSTLSKKFVVHSGQRPAQSLDADLLIGPTAGIVRVNLLSIEFTDGTTWVAPNPTTCSATPSLYVPVTN